MYAGLKKYLEQIATELVFAEAGKDEGLLPINSLLCQIEELLASASPPEPLARAATEARLCLDSIFEGSGTFSADDLKWLGQWVAWWQAALPACESGKDSGPFTFIWQNTRSEAVSQAAPAPQSPVDQGEPAVVLNLDQDGELLGEFINESQEHLQNIEQGVLVLEGNPTDADTLNAIFRAFHTLKGGSGFLNLTAMQTLAHELESLLDLIRQHKRSITPAIINLILEGGDVLKKFVTEIAAQQAGRKKPSPITVPTLRLLAAVRAVLADGTEPGPSALGTGQGTDLAGSPAMPAAKTVPANGGGAPTTAVPGAAEMPEPETAPTVKASITATAVKVDTQKLDSLVDLVGEMVIAQSLVVQNRDLNACQSEQLARDLAQLGRITKDLQRTVMSLRMVPIRATFQKMNRLVRDISGKVGKQVRLVADGEDTEVDRTIVEEISDPLVHMIRNSVDHGIEKPDVRIQRGKPAQGTVWLNAFHQGGNIVIEIRDDGNGLDRERILAKAVEKGLARPDDQLSDAQIFSLIMAAGFSTAESVTNLSGRGVGMDVVKRNIEKLRGKIEIESTPGQGTRFLIYLPLTLAIIDALLVGVGGHCYILPTLLVRESFRPTEEMISTVYGQGEMVNVRGQLRPLLRLYSHLGIEPESTEPTQSIVVVVEAGSDARCVLVDKLLGKQEVVIKSLGETFRGNPCLAGAAILGDGRVGLILDPQALVHLEGTALVAAA